jgi:hypothetical protein
VLHARTELVLTLELRRDRVRISVRDHSTAPETLRHYRADALTGRGLGVVVLALLLGHVSHLSDALGRRSCAAVGPRMVAPAGLVLLCRG